MISAFQVSVPVFVHRKKSLADNRRQIRVRLPADMLRELEKSGNLNDQIVNRLRLASLNRQSIMECAMVRAVGLCFASAEAITGKTIEQDENTLKLALDMTIKMVSYFDSLVKGKPRDGAAKRTVDALLKVAFLDDDKRQSILTGLSAAMR